MRPAYPGHPDAVYPAEIDGVNRVGVRVFTLIGGLLNTVADLLRARNWRMAAAESCKG